MIESTVTNSESPLPMQVTPDSPRGDVYQWNPAATIPENTQLSEEAAGKIERATVALLRLDDPSRLSGRFVRVHNDSVTKLPGTDAAASLGDARPNRDGEFRFDPHHGGGRMEKYPYCEPDRWQRYISASRFGEVNSYYHIDKVAAYVDGLLSRLGHPSLPQVIVRVNAHNAIAQHDGCCDGVVGTKSKQYLPFQGGHYRLPTRKRLTVREHRSLSPAGEIHLGPGFRLTQHGALPDLVGQHYRCNASHNSGTLYHEYGHHLTRHTADLRVNRFRAPHRQCNIKTDVDEAVCDYLAATMMESPHIWAFHHRHDQHVVHRRSLVSTNTMRDFDHDRHADPHANGTILAATLWRLRLEMSASVTDLIVMQSLLLIGQRVDHPTDPNIRQTRRRRSGFSMMLAALLESDQRLFQGQHRVTIEACFEQRGIQVHLAKKRRVDWSIKHDVQPADAGSIERLRAKDPHGILPTSDELLSANQLNDLLQQRKLGPYSLVAVGDVMVGSRARKRTNEFGPDYIFHSVSPLFRRSSLVLGNQEGPIARDADKQPRNHSYKVNPKYTRVLRRAGFNVLTLANNHLLDCGREGVTETLRSLRKHQIQTVGVGRNRETAHQAAIMQAGPMRIGILGYYWNRRTAARHDKPGSARDTAEHLAADIERLRPLVDRVVVTVHWGVPYEREPSLADREKARRMISLGADAVIGHHPHIMQGIEIIDDRPVIYSIGNFAFGTGNSKAESLVAGLRFEQAQTIVDLFPAYVKNRDPRINYQPKLMTGDAADNALSRLQQLCFGDAKPEIDRGVGRLSLPWKQRSFDTSHLLVEDQREANLVR